jgi:hypothetical protein
MWLISKYSTSNRTESTGPLDSPDAAEGIQAGNRRSPAQTSSDGKRINALDAPRIHASAGLQGPQTPDEEKQKSSLSLTTP